MSGSSGHSLGQRRHVEPGQYWNGLRVLVSISDTQSASYPSASFSASAWGMTAGESSISGAAYAYQSARAGSMPGNRVIARHERQIAVSHSSGRINLRQATLRNSTWHGNFSNLRSVGCSGEGRGVGTAAVGGNGVGLAAIVEFEANVVPDHARGDIASGDGEADRVLAGLQQRGVELLDVLVPHAFVGVVA